MNQVMNRVTSSHVLTDQEESQALNQDTNTVYIELANTQVSISDDPYSDRIRCDHPLLDQLEELSDDVLKREGARLGERLINLAEREGRGRVVTLTTESVAEGLIDVGFEREALIPGFYEGERACVVLGAYPEGARQHLAHPKEHGRVMNLLSGRGPRSERATPHTRRATLSDVPALASLLGQTFQEYPTPSDDPAYLQAQLEAGTPFRVVEEEGALIACASADLVREAKTAELTDCATRPEHRGRGLMRGLLSALCDDVKALGYPTAFTLARARIPGVNLAFQGLGFELHGCMSRSCRIGEGLEDMNVWSKQLT